MESFEKLLAQAGKVMAVLDIWVINQQMGDTFLSNTVK